MYEKTVDMIFRVHLIHCNFLHYYTIMFSLANSFVSQSARKYSTCQIVNSWDI